MWFQFDNGDKVKDTITGFVGVITNRQDNITGCVQYIVEGEVKDNDSKVILVDESRLEILPGPKKKVKEDKATPGGPSRRIR